MPFTTPVCEILIVKIILPLDGFSVFLNVILISIKIKLGDIMISRIVIVLLLFLSGCNTLRPIPVVEPPPGTEEEPAQPKYARGGLIPAKTSKQAIANLRIYTDSYFSTADALRGSEFVNSDLGLIGGILAVFGGAAKSVEVAITGGLISAGGSIVSQRYQLRQQALNYEKAGDAMACLYRNAVRLDALPSPLSDEVPVFVNARIDEVRGKLRKNQIAVELLSPSFSDIEAALKKIDSATLKANGAADELFKANLGLKSNSLAQKDVDHATAIFLRAVLEQVFAEMQKCSVSI